jgi:hypothetical protein
VFALDEFCGLTIWQMNDAKSYLRTGAPIRVKPMALNLAGVFDQYRRPKPAAATVADWFEVKQADAAPGHHEVVGNPLID